MRILVIDDDPKVLEFLKSGLEAECFAVDTASDGEQGSFLARTNDYDIVVLDNKLPKKNGREVCGEIRIKNKNVKILVLSALSEIPIKVELLNVGADDYLIKPFSFIELLARIRALMRRQNEATDDVIKIGDLRLDIKRREVMRKGKAVDLTRKEFMLLEFLVKNAGRTVSQGDIMEHVWDMKLDSFSNTLKTHVKNLRNKIDNGRKKSIIRTVSGRGYRIDME